jgi:hypothetical protein
MNDPRLPVKALLLTAPLTVLILALHAWGDGAADSLGRHVSLFQYPERVRAPFAIRSPRRSQADDWAGRALTQFLDDSMKRHGDLLGLRIPTYPVEVVLLDSETDPRRFAGDVAEFLKVNEALYDPDHRAIIVRMEPTIDQIQVTAALRRAAARMLLHDAGSARWSPWLTEGLAGILEGTKSADLKAWTGELPPLEQILSASEADLRSATTARGARLLTAYLMESMPEGFAHYYKASRNEGQVRLAHILERFNDPAREEHHWRDWLKVQK